MCRRSCQRRCRVDWFSTSRAASTSASTSLSDARVFSEKRTEDPCLLPQCLRNQVVNSLEEGQRFDPLIDKHNLRVMRQQAGQQNRQPRRAHSRLTCAACKRRRRPPPPRRRLCASRYRRGRRGQKTGTWLMRRRVHQIVGINAARKLL